MIYANQHYVTSLNPYPAHLSIICVLAWPDYVYWQYIINYVQVEPTDWVVEAKEELIEVKIEKEASPAAADDDVSEPEQKVMKTKPGLWRENTFHHIYQSWTHVSHSILAF